MCLCADGSKLESQPLGKCASRPDGYIVDVLYFNYKYVVMIYEVIDVANITNDMVHYAYDISKRVYAGSLGPQDGSVEDIARKYR